MQMGCIAGTGVALLRLGKESYWAAGAASWNPTTEQASKEREPAAGLQEQSVESQTAPGQKEKREKPARVREKSPQTPPCPPAAPRFTAGEVHFSALLSPPLEAGCTRPVFHGR
ncbi:hypothetical protein SKAU_G00300630 [Synaphobranchus kaupii]|uniref:Uncharacterized protein n=1 Tax=Synaphobranchus kaupii TaxID=118154 RepID=A0A9Q1EVK6_SYNKA|nr:hypothetical protein SKAU_G00300630 [Synaphobranchus kaupii]